MRPLRVALVSEHASPLAVLGGEDAGGQNVHVAELARHLAARGAIVDVYTRRDDPALADVVPLGPGVSVRHVAAGPPRPVSKDDLYPFMGEFSLVLRRAFMARRPDVVHAHFWMSGLASLPAGRSAGIPVVQTFHALGRVKRRHQGAGDTSPLERLAEEEMLATSVDCIIATCGDEADELARMGAPPERVVVIPCGVDSAVFSPAHRRPPRRGARPRLLMLGRLVERKGHDDVIAALATLPECELLIAGGPDPSGLASDPSVRRLRAVAEREGVGDRVRFLGRVPQAEVPDLLRSCELVCCTPWYEPFGIVPLEAMACGVPVVATAVGGMLDSVADGVTGLLVPPRDPTAIAAAVRRLLADPSLCEAMGREGIARVRRRFTWAHVAEQTMAVYADLATGRQLSSVSARSSWAEPA